MQELSGKFRRQKKHGVFSSAVAVRSSRNVKEEESRTRRHYPLPYRSCRVNQRLGEIRRLSPASYAFIEASASLRRQNRLDLCRICPRQWLQAVSVASSKRLNISDPSHRDNAPTTSCGDFRPGRCQKTNRFLEAVRA